MEFAKHALMNEEVRKKVEHLDMLHSLVEVDFTDFVVLLANNSSMNNSISGTTMEGLIASA